MVRPTPPVPKHQATIGGLAPRLVSTLALALLLGALGCGGTAGSTPAAGPSESVTPASEDLGPECVDHATPQRGKPLIVEWPASDRGQVEAAIQQGIVAVRYTGCSMELFNCRGQGAYKYTAVTPKKDQVTITSADELYANLPLGAVDLQAELRRAGRLEVDMTIVGRYETNRLDLQASDLEGDCASATHFASAFTVGAFRFFAGGEATVGGSAEVAGMAGGGMKSRSERQKLKEEGDLNACEAAADSSEPPRACAGLLRIEVLPLAEAGAAPAGPSSDAAFEQATKAIFDLAVAQKFDELLARYRMPRDRFEAVLAGTQYCNEPTDEEWARYEHKLRKGYDRIVEKNARWGRVEVVEPEAQEGLDLIKVHFRYYYGEESDKVEDFTFIRDRRKIYVLRMK